GLVLIEPRGARQKPALAWPNPIARPTDEDAEPMFDDDGLDARLRLLLQQAATDLLEGQPNGPGLWKTLERKAHAVLGELESRGEIAGYHVRCDAETNADSPVPVIEVLIRQPRRVRELVVTVVPAGA